jgi:DNA-binding MarR family transcriptional regulator
MGEARPPDPTIARIDAVLLRLAFSMANPAYHERVLATVDPHRLWFASLPRGQVELLSYLLAHPMSDLSSVASGLGLSKAAVSRRMTSLRRLGLVGYGVGRLGRRSHPIRLTGDGRRLQQALQAARCTVLATSLEGRSVEELEWLAEVLAGLVPLYVVE